MCLGIDIYKDIETDELIRVKNNTVVGMSMYDRIGREKTDKPILFNKKDVSLELKSLKWMDFIPLELWIKYDIPLKENSITVTEYLKKSKDKKRVIIRTTFVFETEEEDLGELFKDYDSNTEEEFLRKIEEEEKVFNDDPSIKYNRV